MNDDQFWKLIETARSGSDGDNEQLLSALREALVALPADQIVGFSKLYDDYRFRAYRWDLWGAAYVMNGGCSDDGFEYFRGWLISRGRKVFELALADPDSLASCVDEGGDEYELEDMLYVAAQAYEEKTGQELPEYDRDFPEIAGTEWSENDVEKLYPKIAQKLAN